MSIRHTLICNGNPWIALCKRILSECILSLHLQVYVKPWKEKINQYDNTTNSRLWLQKMACLQSRPANPLKHLAHHEMKKCNKESWNLLSSWILYQPRVWTFSAFKNCSNCSLQCLQTVKRKDDAVLWQIYPCTNFFRCGAGNGIKIRQRSKRNSNVSLSTFGNLSL